MASLSDDEARRSVMRHAEQMRSQAERLVHRCQNGDFSADEVTQDLCEIDRATASIRAVLTLPDDGGDAR